MKLELGKTYLINWGDKLGELRILEESEKAVRATSEPKSSRLIGSGVWYLREKIDPKVVEELKNR